jgi:hypothetical protein
MPLSPPSFRREIRSLVAGCVIATHPVWHHDLTGVPATSARYSTWQEYAGPGPGLQPWKACPDTACDHHAGAYAPVAVRSRGNWTESSPSS